MISIIKLLKNVCGHVQTVANAFGYHLCIYVLYLFIFASFYVCKHLLFVRTKYRRAYIADTYILHTCMNKYIGIIFAKINASSMHTYVSMSMP